MAGELLIKLGHRGSDYSFDRGLLWYLYDAARGCGPNEMQSLFLYKFQCESRSDIPSSRCDSPL
jgi:hypothetical protein